MRKIDANAVILGLVGLYIQGATEITQKRVPIPTGVRNSSILVYCFNQSFKITIMYINIIINKN